MYLAEQSEYNLEIQELAYEKGEGFPGHWKSYGRR